MANANLHRRPPRQPLDGLVRDHPSQRKAVEPPIRGQHFELYFRLSHLAGSTDGQVTHAPVIEPRHVPLTTNGAGEFQDLVRNPTPHGQDIRLERRCAFLGRHKCCKCVWSASTTTPCSKAGSASAESASPTSAYPAFGGGTSHFETLIPWLALCNARARRAGEGIGHAVHEGDDSLMSLQDFRLRSSGAFFSWPSACRSGPGVRAR